MGNNPMFQEVVSVLVGVGPILIGIVLLFIWSRKLLLIGHGKVTHAWYNTEKRKRTAKIIGYIVVILGSVGTLLMIVGYIISPFW